MKNCVFSGVNKVLKRLNLHVFASQILQKTDLTMLPGEPNASLLGIIKQ